MGETARSMPKNRRWMIGGSIAVTLLVASAAIALIVSTAIIPGNQVQSPELNQPQGLGAVVVGTNDPCPGLDSFDYTEVASSALFDSLVLSDDEGSATSGKKLCVGNSGGFGTLTVSSTMINVTSDDLAGCPDATEAAVGDSTCGAGEGELSGLVLLGLVHDGDRSANGADCNDVGTLISEGATTAAMAQLPEGEYCGFLAVAAYDAQSSPSDRLRSSTDALSWVIQLDGDDGK